MCGSACVINMCAEEQTNGQTSLHPQRMCDQHVCWRTNGRTDRQTSLHPQSRFDQHVCWRTNGRTDRRTDWRTDRLHFIRITCSPLRHPALHSASLQETSYACLFHSLQPDPDASRSFGVLWFRQAEEWIHYLGRLKILIIIFRQAQDQNHYF